MVASGCGTLIIASQRGKQYAFSTTQMDASTDDFIENLEADEDECNTEEEEIKKAAAVELLEPSVWLDISKG